MADQSVSGLSVALKSAEQVGSTAVSPLQLLLDAVSDYAIYMLNPEGVVTSWNPGGRAVQGYYPDEIIGQNFARFFTQQDQESGLPQNLLAQARAQDRCECEGWRVRKDGSLFLASVVIHAIRDEEGALVGFAKITRDITERKNAEAALQKAREQLAHSQKMEALGQLTGGVAHDFNNLLMIVSGHIQTLKKLAAGDAKGLRAAQAIELAAQRGEELARQLLTFSRRQRLNPTAISLRQSVNAFRDMLASSLGNVSLATDISADAWPVEVDESEFELALVNLALNARDAMPDGGVVTINAQNVTLRHGELGEELAGDFVAVTVADTGVGIPADILPKIFDPFFSTKQTGKGTGLGLSQVHGFAYQSGGAVDVSSKLGKGTRVTLYLPKAGSMPAAQRSEQRHPERAGSGTILLVEDNPEVARLAPPAQGRGRSRPQDDGSRM